MSNRKLSPDLINTIKVLRMNGIGFHQIAAELELSVSTVHKYGKDVIILPDRLQKDPWAEAERILGRPNSKLQEKGDFKTQIKEKDYWKEEHESGTPFEGPVDLFSLEELKEMMEEPTNYISPLNQEEWYNYYIAPLMFRGISSTLSKTQVKVNNFLDDNLWALVEVFRKMGKTVLIEGRLVRPICEHRDNNYAVQSEAIERSEERLQVISNHLTGNKRLIAHYGYLPLERSYKGMKGGWKKDQITVKRDTIQTDPTIKAVSWKDARLLGGHFHGILFDDPWSSKLEENSEKNREKWFRWYDSTLIGCMEDNAWQHIICTRKGLYDIYRDLEDRGVFAVYKQPAILEYPTDYEYVKNIQGKITGVVIRSDDGRISDDCNGRFSMEFFLMQKALMSETGWEMEYQLNPVPFKGRYFDWDDLLFIKNYNEFHDIVRGNDPFSDSPQYLKRAKYIGAMDMAFGKSETAHYTALVIWAFFKGKYYWLQSYIKKRTSKMNKAAMIHKAKREFPFMNTVYIEADLTQSEYVEDLTKLISGVRIEPVLSRHEEKAVSKGDIGKLTPKHARIVAQVEDIVERRELIINESMNHFDEFRREFKEFPRSKYDDLMDAGGIAASRLKKSRYKLFGFSG